MYRCSRPQGRQPVVQSEPVAPIRGRVCCRPWCWHRAAAYMAAFYIAFAMAGPRFFIFVQGGEGQVKGAYIRGLLTTSLWA